MSRSKCGQASLAQSHLPGPGQHFSIHLATVWRDSGFIPAAAVSDGAQQGSHCTPLPQCFTSSQQGTSYLGHSAQPVAQTLASQFCSHLLDPPSPTPVTQQDVPLSFLSQLPWVPLSAGEGGLSFMFTLDAR